MQKSQCNVATIKRKGTKILSRAYTRTRARTYVTYDIYIYVYNIINNIASHNRHQCR